MLLVEADSPERQRLGEALEAGGFEVVECPGPTEPDDDCVGLRTGLCPLLTDVDVVVLDVQLEANDVEFRTTSEELLNLYLEAVGRWSRWGSMAAGWTRRLLRLRRSPDADELVRGVHQLVGRVAANEPVVRECLIEV